MAKHGDRLDRIDREILSFLDEELELSGTKLLQSVNHSRTQLMSWDDIDSRLVKFTRIGLIEVYTNLLSRQNYFKLTRKGREILED